LDSLSPLPPTPLKDYLLQVLFQSPITHPQFPEVSVFFYREGSNTNSGFTTPSFRKQGGKEQGAGERRQRRKIFKGVYEADLV
jgi:hypothetical protein